MNTKQIQIFDRASSKILQENIPCKKLLHFLYKNDHFINKTSRNLLSKLPIFSSFIGWWMRRSWTKRSIEPFIKNHDIKINEFEKADFDNFNDFFIRKLKFEARPIAKDTAICPCDGRYLFMENILQNPSFYVKGTTLDFSDLIGNIDLYDKFKDGSMLLARLAPKDYHRFHAPCNCRVQTMQASKKSNLYSVNPIALGHNINYLLSNKRVLILMESEEIGEFIMIFIGATNVGSIHFTKDKKSYQKGEEIGYFSFGGSMVMTIFQKNKVKIANDLLHHSGNQIETLIKMGESFQDE